MLKVLKLSLGYQEIKFPSEEADLVLCTVSITEGSSYPSLIHYRHLQKTKSDSSEANLIKKV